MPQTHNRPDIMLLGAAWKERVLLRAQFIEQGYEVVAIDEWPMPRLYRRADMKPRAMVIDLHELPVPRETLDEVRHIMSPQNVLVVVALGTVTIEDVQRFGFRAIGRPATIGEIVTATSALLKREP